MSDVSFIDRLVEGGVLSQEGAARIKNESVSGASPESLLSGEGIAEDQIIKAKSETYGVPAYSLGGQKVSFEF